VLLIQSFGRSIALGGHGTGVLHYCDIIKTAHNEASGEQREYRPDPKGVSLAINIDERSLAT
jgi:hypothetical protein